MFKETNTIGKYFQIYRGYVVWNRDPLYKGRIKVFVPGVYPSEYSSDVDLLPWAEPAMTSFGGGSPNQYQCLNSQVGWSSVPHAGNIKTGSQVFIFFQGGNINFPIYFAVSQSGNGWLAEHQNQHVFKSDNVRIRIQESLQSDKTTCKFDSYTDKQSSLGKKSIQKTCQTSGFTYGDEGIIKQLPTRVDIQIEASKYNAVNLNIHGNVNMHIDGDWITEHIGNKYQYHKGDTYIKNQGPIYIEQYGTMYKNLSGNYMQTHMGNYDSSRTGNTNVTLNGTVDQVITKTTNLNYYSDVTITYGQNCTINVTDNLVTCVGKDMITTVAMRKCS